MQTITRRRVYEKRQAPGSSFPPGPPSPVRIGNMIIVSSLGNDGTGARQDVPFHFLTIDAALAAAQAGDTIIIYPGSYTTSSVDGLAVQDFLTVHCFPGVTITGTIFNGTREGFKLTGNAELVCEGIQQLSTPGIVSTTVIQCDSILFNEGARWWYGGSHSIEVTNDIIVGTDSLQGLVFLNLAATAHNFKLICRDILLANDNGGVYGMPFINIETSSVFDIKFRRMIGIGGDTPAILFFNQLGKGSVTDYRVNITGDIWHNSGSPDKYCIRCNANNDWPTSGQNGIYIKGNLIGPNAASAINLIAGKLDFTGDMYFKNPNYVIEMTSDPLVINEPSTLFLHDGTSNNPTSRDFVHYAEPENNLVQFKNYKVVQPGGFLVSCPDPGALYQVLSCYSTVDVDTANVTNEIASTTLIVDPLIK